MPWQRLVADVGAEVDPDTGLPAYREVVVYVPRQSGKTSLILSWECDRTVAWGVRQRCVYSAQTGSDARKKLLEDQVPVLQESGLKRTLRRVVRAAGQEAVIFRTGSRIDLMPTTTTAGHGRTIDLGVIDEAFADYDSRREQALLPAMVTRADAQMLVASTAGTDASVYLNAKVAAGRAAVAAGVRSEIAFFEWSAEGEDVDVEDPDVWRSCMPALDLTIGEPAIRHALRTMLGGGVIDGMTGRSGFLRAFLNVPTHSDGERVIPIEAWTAVQDPWLERVPEPSFGLDVNPERTWGSIVAAGGDGVEVVDHRPGVGWMVERAADITSRWAGTIAVDPASPAGALIPDLQQADVEVVEIGGRELVQACGAFYDAVAERTIRIRPHASLDAAVAGAAKRESGDAWAWARKSSDADITPLVAATLALALSVREGEEGPALW